MLPRIHMFSKESCRFDKSLDLGWQNSLIDIYLHTFLLRDMVCYYQVHNLYRCPRMCMSHTNQSTNCITSGFYLHNKSHCM